MPAATKRRSKRRMSPADRAKTRSKPYREKFAKVMRENARGTLHAGRGRGRPKNKKQAMAIAHSEAMKAAGGKAKKK